MIYDTQSDPNSSNSAAQNGRKPGVARDPLATLTPEVTAFEELRGSVRETIGCGKFDLDALRAKAKTLGVDERDAERMLP